MRWGMWRRRALLAERLVVDLTRERDAARALVAEQATAKGDPDRRPGGGGRITLGPDGRMRGYDATGELVFDTVAPTERTALMARLINRCSVGPTHPDVVDTAERCGNDIGGRVIPVERILEMRSHIADWCDPHDGTTGDSMRELVDMTLEGYAEDRSDSARFAAGPRHPFADGGD